jgi:hypothetical protein
LGRKGAFIKFPERQPEQNTVKYCLRESLDALFEEDVVLGLYSFASRMRTQNAVVDPSLHDKSSSSEEDECSAEESPMLHVSLLFEVFKERPGESPDEQRENFLKGDHLA